MGSRQVDAGDAAALTVRQISSGIRNAAAQRCRQGAVGPYLTSRVAPHWARPAFAPKRPQAHCQLPLSLLPGRHPSSQRQGPTDWGGSQG